VVAEEGKDVDAAVSPGAAELGDLLQSYGYAAPCREQLGSSDAAEMP
jgi:hypothetical protein